MSPKLTWKSVPFIERPYHTMFVLAILIFMAVVLLQITVVSWETPIMYYLSMLLLILSLLPYFIVTKYEFYEDEVVVNYSIIKIKRSYSEFGCFYADKYGVMLSTFKMPRRLDSFRGLSIRFSKSKTEMDELITLLKVKIGKQY